MPMTHSLHIFVEFDLTDLLRSVLLKARQRVRESKNSAEESSNLSGLQVHIFHHHLISYLFHLHWGMLTYVIHRIKIKILGVVTLWAWLLVCLMVVISHCSTFLTLLKSLLRFPSFFFFYDAASQYEMLTLSYLYHQVQYIADLSVIEIWVRKGRKDQRPII